MLRGSSWVIRGLQVRTDCNGICVTIVDDGDSTTRLRVVTPAGEYLRVQAHRLQSLHNPSTYANMVLDAEKFMRAHARDDRDLAQFLSNWERGDQDGALSAAAKWSLREIERPGPTLTAEIEANRPVRREGI